MDQVVKYVETHLRRNMTNCLSEPDLLNLLGGGGGSLVDVVFYVVPHTGEIELDSLGAESVKLTLPRRQIRRH